MLKSSLIAFIALSAATPALAQSVVQPMVYFADIIKKPEVASALKQQLPADALKAAKTYAESGPNGPLTQYGALHTTFACKAHFCDTDKVTIAFGQNGAMWSAYTKGGKVQVFGNPPANVRAVLIEK